MQLWIWDYNLVLHCSGEIGMSFDCWLYWTFHFNTKKKKNHKIFFVHWSLHFRNSTGKAEVPLILRSCKRCVSQGFWDTVSPSNCAYQMCVQLRVNHEYSRGAKAAVKSKPCSSPALDQSLKNWKESHSSWSEFLMLLTARKTSSYIAVEGVVCELQS